MFSCVVDEHPRFHLDALRWFAALTEVAGVDPADLVVHAVGSDQSEVLDFLAGRGVRVRSVAAFDERSPHCNKIAGAQRLAEEDVRGTAVLCDTDVALLEDPRSVELPPGSVAGKVVDTPVPPLEVLRGIFAEAGLTEPEVVPLPWGDEWTLSGNNNGGLYLVPGPLLALVSTAWARWARWLLDRSALLSDWTTFVDQVALALALTDEGIGSVALEPRWNTPTHDIGRMPADPPPPAGIHYHQEVEGDGRIKSTGTAPIDQRIDTVNRAIAEVWGAASPQTTFWRWHHLASPDRDPSHRGAHHQARRELVARLCDLLRPASVLDVGCGEGDSTDGLRLPHYTGIDLSEERIARAKERRPDGEHLVGTLADHPRQADLTLSLAVLIHEPDVDAYRRHVEALWRSARRALVVSGYEEAPSPVSPIHHFHEPLSVTLEKVAPEAERYPVQAEAGAVTFVVLRRPADPHPRDYGPDTLAPLVDRHPDPLGLLALRLTAWRTTGFYPDHAPRLWEYPVVARQVVDALPPRSRVVDVGTGVVPLVPYLTEQGFGVQTVDPSDLVRSWPPEPDCNEWGFLDYAAAGLASRSWNTTLDRLPRRPPFDGAISVSVIEHLPATARRRLLADMAARVRRDGLVVLTVDLVRGRDDLWDRNLGVEVEDPARHGVFDDVIAEAASVGLATFRQETVREWGDTHVDIGLLAMRRTRIPLAARARSASRAAGQVVTWNR